MSGPSGPPTGSRGGAPVGFISELPQVDAASVCFLRLWCESAETRHQADEDLYDLLGPRHGPVAVDSLRQMCEVFSQFARRPVMRHHSGCSCLGADEACFANLVSEAATGQREDALMFAMLMVRADFAPVLVGLAEQFGLALQVLTRSVRSAEPAQKVPAGSTVH